MSEHNHSSRWFNLLYCTRVKVHKGQTPIINLSFIFTLLAAMSAPWVAVAGLIAALALGYRFSIQKNAPEFTANFDEVVRDAARNVKNAVDSVVTEEENHQSE